VSAYAVGDEVGYAGSVQRPRVGSSFRSWPSGSPVVAATAALPLITIPAGRRGSAGDA